MTESALKNKAFALIRSGGADPLVCTRPPGRLLAPVHKGPQRRRTLFPRSAARSGVCLLISGLLLGLLPVSAQVTLYPGYFPTDLKQYLNLTDADVASIQQASTDYSQPASTKQARISELQNEIAAETQKDQPDPMALGVRYAEIESIRRDLTSQLAALRDKLRSSLDDAQRSKLTALNDARNLQPIVNDAQCVNLLDTPRPLFGNVIPADRLLGAVSIYSSFTLNGCLPYYDPAINTLVVGGFPPQLLQYLVLSSDQADTITSLNTTNQQRSTERQQNISQLQAQIADETAKDTLDPLALGTLYAQAETIRRSIANDLTALRNSARAVLNDMQRVKLNSLDDARKLRPLITEATCQNLLDPQVTVFLLGLPTVQFTVPSSSCVIGGTLSQVLPPTAPTPNP
jgi:hypothetical protein